MTVETDVAYWLQCIARGSLSVNSLVLIKSASECFPFEPKEQSHDDEKKPDRKQREALPSFDAFQSFDAGVDLADDLIGAQSDRLQQVRRKRVLERFKLGDLGFGFPKKQFLLVGGQAARGGFAPSAGIGENRRPSREKRTRLRREISG